MKLMIMADLLKTRIEDLQLEYLEILKNAREMMTSKNQKAIIDEINLFWKRNINIVQLYLATHVVPFDTYVFTATVYLDVADYEHLPFLSIGKQHIMDDPLCRHFQMLDIQATPTASTEITKITAKTIDDNIQILEICNPFITLLPIRFLSPYNEEDIYKQAKDIFLSMFSDDIQTLDQYHSLDSINKIESSLLPNLSEQLIFEGYSDFDLPFADRFKKHLDKNKLLLPDHENISHVFLFVILGYISQALDVLLTSAEYRTIPYIRFDVCYAYIRLLYLNFDCIPEIKNIVFKCGVVHILHDMFSKEKVKQLSLDDYVQLVQCNQEKETLFDTLKEHGVFDDTALPNSMAPIIKEYLVRINAF